MPNVNHHGFEYRLALVEEILQEYGLQLSEPATESSFLSAPFHTVKPPLEGVSTLVLRLSNPQAMGLNHRNRVQNEVAAMEIARAGLHTFQAGL
ncbi:phosphotransferase enzyme family protein [Penicillium verhagenii]|nr:phosphotransferase enzyme family protein [Penicillium verhagenii]